MWPELDRTFGAKLGEIQAFVELDCYDVKGGWGQRKKGTCKTGVWIKVDRKISDKLRIVCE